ncbi:MAG: YggS family pyridoxal phosphate-dependent enzyme [Clostridia bacterium]|nr:YggS family pyridoxal phosphate-dependent enzyme [Clostridia bacterium]
MGISDNIAAVKANIRESAAKAGRAPEDITLAAVTKFQTAERVNEAIAAGVRVIAENRAQELAEKYPLIDKPEGLRIHFIGHLQKNKIKYIIDKVDMVQSVDSVELAQALSAACEKHGRELDVLIQVNIGNEPQKSGFSVRETLSAAAEIASIPRLRVRGLMAILPIGVEKAEAMKLFSEMCKLFLDIRGKISDNKYISILSMGMTDDYEWAVEGGSTLVRVGRAIFGERNQI